ncbi:respiratory nitrate reductase subunit gamma [Neisseria sp. N95_16]|uniref:nitrate reductase (quinone) n=1 Tax=Neisseria brasiliensis TaxID=2666100 RepID=A0A5Q3S102_9NEIS|nr:MULTISPECIES: respiratory nitrate reductase subunit gamma [Neisseria]MRN37343.1 respiratory nitrate reductase subunit gamma [Neisseria brasiliensis]PJO09381.1 respiratory nitrate reductase subunit gamma [Neisseria sp. N95_16]PJO77759.1 respiratory nitrate reductase subunit gamma [Neisseria sp. N177_16]QGL25662.1 respiratory nitrate reductase subunit gamma [Neisseria brasiliensis]
MNTFNQFFFGIYPYICLAVFFFGSLVRFDREQYSWKSDSSQLLFHGQLRLGSILMHVGILAVFFGHLFGLLTPLWFWDAIGVSHGAKQVFAMVMGGVFGVMALVGLILLILRRFKIDRINANSSWQDKLVLIWLLITLVLGLCTIFVSMGHLDGHEMVKLMHWAQYIVTFRGGAASYLADVNFLFKLHIFMGMTFFFIFPFTRMVHVWSGFASVAYVGRAWQLVRRR